MPKLDNWLPHSDNWLPSSDNWLTESDNWLPESDNCTGNTVVLQSLLLRSTYNISYHLQLLTISRLTQPLAFAYIRYLGSFRCQLKDHISKL